MKFFVEALKHDTGLLWLILLLGIVSVVLFFERLFHYHRCSINVQDFIQGVFNNLKRNNIVESISICDDTPGPIAHMTRQAILRSPMGEGELEKAIDEVSYIEIARLESKVNVIATIAQVAPVAGLMGTVIGMISSFNTIREGAGGVVNLNDLAPGISFSLVTTAVGLFIASFSYIAYNFLISKIERIIHEMEVVRGELNYFLKKNVIDLSEIEGITDKKTTFQIHETSSFNSDDELNDEVAKSDDENSTV